MVDHRNTDGLRKKILRATTGFALFCFLLPFLTVSCPGFEATLSGTDLMAGTRFEKQFIPPQGLAFAALLCTLMGLALSFAGNARTESSAFFTGLGGLSLIALAAHLHRSMSEASNGVLHLKFEVGFWLCLLALGAGALIGFSGLLQALSSNRDRASIPSSETG